jgi:hypothetical protein
MVLGRTLRSKSYETFFFSTMIPLVLYHWLYIDCWACIVLVFKNMWAVLQRFVAHETSNDFELADFYRIATLMSIILPDWDLVQCLECWFWSNCHIDVHYLTGLRFGAMLRGSTGFNSSSLDFFFFFSFLKKKKKLLIFRAQQRKKRKKKKSTVQVTRVGGWATRWWKGVVQPSPMVFLFVCLFER